VKRMLIVAALCAGALITYVDSRPTWDDSGITACAILVTCGTLAFVAPKRPWVWALAVGVWIPLLGVVRTGNYGSIVALVVALVGAYGGMALRNAVAPVRR
jgi:hypothetical protein